MTRKRCSPRSQLATVVYGSPITLAADRPSRQGENPGDRRAFDQVDRVHRPPGILAASEPGAVKVGITGDFVDARSRKVLIRFKQERRSGFGMFGGGYGELFIRTARQIGAISLVS